ncbi:MAG: LysR family transcriptional regulator [Pseudomonadota bacterium]
MNILKGLEVFVTVAEHQGIAPAARVLNMSTSAVSRHLQELENWTGQQFFRRTTRSMSLTEVGIKHLEKANLILEGLRDFQNVEHGDDQAMTGTIKLTAPLFVLRRILVDPLADFQRTFPGIKLQILSSERFVDLVAEGYDVAFRIGALQDSSLKIRKLMDIQLLLVASPEYVKLHGKPKVVADLKHHQCLLDTAPAYRTKWPIFDQTAKRGVTVDGTICVNNGEVIEQYALNGIGIALLPEALVADHIREKRLVQILPKAERHSYGLYIAHPEMRIVPPKVRAFVDFIADQKLK